MNKGLTCATNMNARYTSLITHVDNFFKIIQGKTKRYFILVLSPVVFAGLWRMRTTEITLEIATTCNANSNPLRRIIEMSFFAIKVSVKVVKVHKISLANFF
jgi:hypothetical protein